MNRKPYLLLMPLLLLSVLFFLGIGNALIQSLGYIPAFGMTDFTLDYYHQVLSEPSLFASVKISFMIALLSSVLAALFGVVLCAALVSVSSVSGKTFQIIKIPILVPHTVVAFLHSCFFSEWISCAGTLSAWLA